MELFRERFAKGLIALGYVLTPSTSKKYHLYCKEGSSAAFFWLGKAGAVRYSNIRRIDTSVPAAYITKARIVAAGKEVTA